MRMSLNFLLLVIIGCNSGVTGPNLGQTAGPEYDGLRLEVTFDRAAIHGDPVTFHIDLTNVGHHPVYEFEIPIFDVFVLDTDGDVVWNRNHGGAFPTSGGHTVSLSPGESFELDIQWQQNANDEVSLVSPGEYAAFAAFFPSSPPVIVTNERELVILSQQ